MRKTRKYKRSLVISVSEDDSLLKATNTETVAYCTEMKIFKSLDSMREAESNGSYSPPNLKSLCGRNVDGFPTILLAKQVVNEGKEQPPTKKRGA